MPVADPKLSIVELAHVAPGTGEAEALSVPGAIWATGRLESSLGANTFDAHRLMKLAARPARCRRRPISRYSTGAQPVEVFERAPAQTDPKGEP